MMLLARELQRWTKAAKPRVEHGATKVFCMLIPRYSRGYRDALSRAQTILLWLAQSVAPGHPLGASLTAFYGGLARQIGANCLQADARSLAEIQSDIRDILAAAG